MRTGLKIRTHKFCIGLSSCAGMILFGMRRSPFTHG